MHRISICTASGIFPAPFHTFTVISSDVYNRKKSLLVLGFQKKFIKSSVYSGQWVEDRINYDPIFYAF